MSTDIDYMLNPFSWFEKAFLELLLTKTKFAFVHIHNSEKKPVGGIKTIMA